MKTISNAELRDLLADAGIEHPNLSDLEYKLVTDADLKKLKRILFFIRLLPFKSEARDCDDFAIFAKALARFFFGNLAFGEIWADGISSAGGYHAANFFVDENKQLHLYEPQNGKIKDFKPTGDRILTII